MVLFTTFLKRQNNEVMTNRSMNARGLKQGQGVSIKRQHEGEFWDG